MALLHEEQWIYFVGLFCLHWLNYLKLNNNTNDNTMVTVVISWLNYKRVPHSSTALNITAVLLHVIRSLQVGHIKHSHVPVCLGVNSVAGSLQRDNRAPWGWLRPLQPIRPQRNICGRVVFSVVPNHNRVNQPLCPDHAEARVSLRVNYHWGASENVLSSYTDREAVDTRRIFFGFFFQAFRGILKLLFSYRQARLR